VAKSGERQAAAIIFSTSRGPEPTTLDRKDMQQAALIAVGLVFCAAVIYAAIADLTTFTIPNWVSGTLVLGFGAYALVRWNDIPVIFHLVLGAATFMICVVFWKLGWLGGGDVKFLGAASLWMGPHNIVPFMLVLALAGAAFAFLLMWVRRWNLNRILG
jgi:prepilin peptidase CpaA